MSPRLRRLFADLRQMNELAQAQPSFSFRADGEPPETYQVMINVPGLASDGDGALVVRQVHRASVYLHGDYPRRPPVIQWMTPIVHPNILGPERNGGVCIGAWSASESLADLMRRLIDLVAYRSFNTADALDKAAASLVRELGVAPGADLNSLVRASAGVPEPVVRIGGGGAR